MRRIILFKFILIILINITVGVEIDSCYEITDFKKYLFLSNQKIMVTDFNPDSSLLNRKENEIVINASWFSTLDIKRRYKWQKPDWLSVRLATSSDSIYTDTIMFDSLCPGKLVRDKYGKSDHRPDCVIGPPVVVLQPGNYSEIQRNDFIHNSNIFAIKLCDSVNLALSIDTLFDGKRFTERGRRKLNRSTIKEITYYAIVTPKSTKGYGGTAEYQYSASFGSYPDFRLFHLPDDFSLFVIWGREVDGDGVTVHQITINPRGGKTIQKLTDFAIGDEVFQQTDYYIDRGILRRKVTEKDPKTGKITHYKLKWQKMWMPDDRGD